MILAIFIDTMVERRPAKSGSLERVGRKEFYRGRNKDAEGKRDLPEKEKCGKVGGAAVVLGITGNSLYPPKGTCKIGINRECCERYITKETAEKSKETEQASEVKEPETERHYIGFVVHDRKMLCLLP